MYIVHPVLYTHIELNFNHCLCFFLYFYNIIGPSAPTGVNGSFPVVVWNAPDQRNGIITGYRLTFTRTGTSTRHTVTTDDDQIYYVIRSGVDIPADWSTGSFTVKVSHSTVVLCI